MSHVVPKSIGLEYMAPIHCTLGSRSKEIN